MEKIKFLYGLIVISLLLLIVNLISILISAPTEFKLRIILTNTPFFLFLGLIFIERGLYFSIRKGYFNTQSISKFKHGGYLFIISGLTTITMSVFLLSNNEVSQIKMILRQDISQAFLILIIGFGLVVISDFIKRRRSQLELENDLTI